jgi:hypothetical protein
MRFGCGFLLGCFVAVGALLTLLWSVHIVAAVCVLAGLLCGCAVLKFGDTFWDHARRWWWWTWL